MRPTTVVTSVAAMPMPASSALPSWPMRAESVSTKMGSAMSAPKAGTARARMRRFSEDSAVLVPALVLGLAAVFAVFFAGAPGSVPPDAVLLGAVPPGSAIGCFCVLILLGYSPPPRRMPGRGAGCTLRDRRARCAVRRLGRVVRRGRGVPSWWGGRCLVRVWRPAAWRGRRGAGRRGPRSR